MNSTTKELTIYCCGCAEDVEARLITGEEAYPHRKDLYSLPSWKCDECGNLLAVTTKQKIEHGRLELSPQKRLRRTGKRFTESSIRYGKAASTHVARFTQN